MIDSNIVIRLIFFQYEIMCSTAANSCLHFTIKLGVLA